MPKGELAVAYALACEGGPADVELTERTFCPLQAGSRPSSLDSVLSLGHVRVLTLICTNQDWTLPAVATDRLAGRTSLSVGRLTLGVYRLFDDQLATDDDPRWSILFFYTDPEEVIVQPSPYAPNPGLLLAMLEFESAHWPRLRTLELDRATSATLLGSNCLVRRRRWDGKPNTTPLTIIYVVPGSDAINDPLGMSYQVYLDLALDATHDLLLPTSRVIAVIVRVAREEQKEAIVEALKRDFAGLDATTREQRLALISYEVANATSAPESTAT